jgi:hypothetical protein
MDRYLQKTKSSALLRQKSEPAGLPGVSLVP